MFAEMSGSEIAMVVAAVGTALVTIITALFTGVTALYVIWLRSDVITVKESVNGMKEELVASTRKESFRAGGDAEREKVKGEAGAAALAVAQSDAARGTPPSPTALPVIIENTEVTLPVEVKKPDK